MVSAQIRKVIAAGMIGNVLEWYDFAIYGYFAASIGRQFFPHEDAVAQLLSAFGVFAVGYLMRPVGGALIGHIGDRLVERGHDFVNHKRLSGFRCSARYGGRRCLNPRCSSC